MSKYAHVEWIDLEGNGVATEVAVLKRDAGGSIYFIKLASLDDIDRQRLASIVTNRNAKSFELWDLLGQSTLGNGVNALIYFQQLVLVKTPSGQIMKPTPGKAGMRQRG